MRLFVGIEVARDVRGRATALAERLRIDAARLAPEAKITWIPAERQHLTVRFIGETPDRGVSAIEAALRVPIAQRPFDVLLRGIGTFPRSGAPRVLWLGIGDDGVDALAAIEREVSARLLPLGIASETRPYAPHLTLARVRDAAGLRAGRWTQDFEGAEAGVSRVATITLFESRLSPKGPTYVSLLETPLQAA